MKRVIIIVGIVVIVLMGSVSIWVLTHQPTTAPIDQPAYQTILPKGKSISDLGGWKRISPATSSPVFAYTDTLSGVSISVSEQPLPDSFKTDTAKQVASLASSYSATDSVDASGTKVYIGTNTKGPQSVILTKNNLLILIKSEAKIADNAWAGYISQLN